MGDVFAQEYKSSLADLHYNSKPLITALTQLAEENKNFSREVVRSIVEHVTEVPTKYKLPSLYVIDSIIKNVGEVYLDLFGEVIVSVFTSVFEKVDEQTRGLMYKLRQTWSQIFANSDLYSLDIQVKKIDPAWPVTAQPPPQSIYLNPRFLEPSAEKEHVPNVVNKAEEAKLKAQQSEILKNLFAKQEQLRLLEEKKQELASKQLLSTECIQSSITYPKPLISKLNHRDPRLQKAGVAIVLNKVASQPLLETPVSAVVTKEPEACPVVSISTPSSPTSKTPTLSSVVSVVTKPSPKRAKSSDKKSRHSKDKKKSQKSKEVSNKSSEEKVKTDVDLRQLSVPTGQAAKATVTREHKESKENVDEPPEKRAKEQSEKDSDTDSLFGGVDQDYRQITEGSKSQHDGWATYKAAHPDEFNKNPLQNKTENVESQMTLPRALSFENEKMGPQTPEYFEPIQCDRLGRPRLNRMRSRNEFQPNFYEGDNDFHQYGSRKGLLDKHTDVALFMLQDTQRERMLFEAEEKYRMGKISQSMYQDIRQDLDALKFSNCQDGNFSSMMGREFDFSPSSHLERLNLQGPSVPPPAARTFKLDNKMRTIHFVGHKAIVLLDNNEPRELTFVGEPTQVFIEGLKPITLRFNGQPIEFDLDGECHSMKFGAPSRELYIDNHPYEGKFGGPSFRAKLGNGRIYKILLCGPGPRVQVSPKPAYDLYNIFLAQDMQRSSDVGQYDVDFRQSAGRNTDMDWRDMRQNHYDRRPLNHLQGPGKEKSFSNRSQYKDQEPGSWDMRDESRMGPLSLQQSSQGPSKPWRRNMMPFHDVQMTNSPQHTPPHDNPTDWDRSNDSQTFQPIESGHEPYSHTKAHNQQNTGHGVELNQTYSNQRNSPQQFDYTNPTDKQPRSFQNRHNVGVPLRSNFNERRPRGSHRGQRSQWGRNSRQANATDASSNRIPLLPPPPMPPLHMYLPDNATNKNNPATSSALEAPQHAVAPPMWFTKPTPTEENTTASTAPADSATADKPQIDISTLFQKLLAAGIINKPTPDEKKTDEENEEKGEGDKEDKDPTEEPIPPIEMKLESLKGNYPGVVSALHRGSQCASCGMRFKETHSERYSRHLDWHFRVNRREKDGVRKAFSRKWYYEVEDWIQFEEFEDFEERAPSFFELDVDKQYQTEDVANIPSIPASGQETEACVVCGEPFKLFWVEDEEEWHLQNAVRHDEEAYHPSCYEDHIKASAAPVTPTPVDSTESILKLDIKQEVSDECDTEIEEAVSETIEMLTLGVFHCIESCNKVEIKMEVEDECETVPEEELLQGKPGEEEIIGMIADSEMEMDTEPKIESEKVVIESGGIVIKMRAESLKPSSPAVEAPIEKLVNEQTDDVEEFRLPTPDPRFQNLPPVQRGTELSGLCCIM